MLQNVRSAFADFKKEKSRQFHPDFFFHIDILEKKVLYSISQYRVSETLNREAIMKLLEDE